MSNRGDIVPGACVRASGQSGGGVENTQNCSIDENSNIYQNTSFHRKFINYNFPTPVEKDKDYEVMSFRRLSGPYIEMTPGKLVTAV